MIKTAACDVYCVYKWLPLVAFPCYFKTSNYHWSMLFAFARKNYVKLQFPLMYTFRKLALFGAVCEHFCVSMMSF